MNYLSHWIDLSKSEATYDGLCELIVKEQFLNSCAKDLAVYLRERDPENLKELGTHAEQFLIAHGRKLASGTQSSSKLDKVKQ